MAQVRLEQLSRVYPGSVCAIDQVDLEVADGELLVVVGPSGCGKTTLLRLIAGLEPATAGTVRIGGRDTKGVAPYKREVAMVFQNQALHPYMTVYENITFGPRLRSGGNLFKRFWRHMAKSETANQMPQERSALTQRVREVASTLGIATLLGRRPHQLSGGERQRVAVAKALLRQPAVMLLDEPLSNLDAQLRVQLRREFKAVHQHFGGTTIYVTHDQAEAMTLADRVAVLAAGRLQQVDQPMEVYARPANRFVAGFIGSPAMNFFRGKLTCRNDHSPDFVFQADDWSAAISSSTAVDLSAWLGRPIVLGLRPEDIHFCPPSDSLAADTIQATVTLVEPLGDATIIYLTTGQSAEKTKAADASSDASCQSYEIACKAASGVQTRPGQHVRLWLDIQRAHLFDDATGCNIRTANSVSAVERPAA